MIEEPVVGVHIPLALRPYTGGHDEVITSGYTVGEVLESLGNEHAGVIARVLSPLGEIDPAYEVWLGGSDIRSLDGLNTPIGLEELVSIVPAKEPAIA